MQETLKQKVSTEIMKFATGRYMNPTELEENIHTMIENETTLRPFPDEEKVTTLKEDAYLLNLQNLSERVSAEKAFQMGIETGFDEFGDWLNNSPDAIPS
jgi:hypothetical protein